MVRTGIVGTMVVGSYSRDQASRSSSESSFKRWQIIIVGYIRNKRLADGFLVVGAFYESRFEPDSWMSPPNSSPNSSKRASFSKHSETVTLIGKLMLIQNETIKDQGLKLCASVPKSVSMPSDLQ